MAELSPARRYLRERDRAARPIAVPPAVADRIALHVALAATAITVVATLLGWL